MLRFDNLGLGGPGSVLVVVLGDLPATQPDVSTMKYLCPFSAETEKCPLVAVS